MNKQAEGVGLDGCWVRGFLLGKDSASNVSSRGRRVSVIHLMEGSTKILYFPCDGGGVMYVCNEVCRHCSWEGDSISLRGRARSKGERITKGVEFHLHR